MDARITGFLLAFVELVTKTEFMKRLVALGLFWWVLKSYGQQGNEDQGKSVVPACFYIDSMKVDMDKTYFDVDGIKSVFVSKGYDSATKTNGKVFITSKDPHYLFITLHDILDRQIEGSHTPILLFIIDDQIIMDTAHILIMSTAIKKVQVIPTSEIEYVKQIIPSMAVVKIETTARKSPKVEGPTIRLR